MIASRVNPLQTQCNLIAPLIFLWDAVAVQVKGENGVALDGRQPLTLLCLGGMRETIPPMP